MRMARAARRRADRPPLKSAIFACQPPQRRLAYTSASLLKNKLPVSSGQRTRRAFPQLFRTPYSVLRTPYSVAEPTACRTATPSRDLDSGRGTCANPFSRHRPPQSDSSCPKSVPTTYTPASNYLYTVVLFDFTINRYIEGSPNIQIQRKLIFFFF